MQFLRYARTDTLVALVTTFNTINHIKIYIDR